MITLIISNNIFWGGFIIDIKKLQLFLFLAQFKSFSKVADISYMSQSTVSKQIFQLEEELGVTLFNRKDKENFLTSEGIVFWKYANEIINMRDQSLIELRNLSSQTTNILKIGATQIYGEIILPKLIVKLSSLFPNIQISLELGSSHNIYNKLHNNQLDLCFLSNYISYDRDSILTNFYKRDELVFICSKYHPFSKKEISFEHLEKENFVIKNEHSSLYKYITNLLIIKKESFSFKSFIEIGSQRGILELVRKNYGIGIVSKLLLNNSNLKKDINTFKIQGYTLEYLERDIHILHSKNNTFLERIIPSIIDTPVE